MTIKTALLELGLLGLTERDAERRRAIDAGYASLKAAERALERVKGLVDSEGDEPLDDAIRIATEALEGEHDPYKGPEAISLGVKAR